MITKTNQRKRRTKSRKSKMQTKSSKKQTKSRKSKRQSKRQTKSRKSRQHGGKCQSTYGFIPGVDIGGSDGVHIKSVMAPINNSKTK